MLNINDKLLAAINTRGMKREPFAYGIIPADRYVRSMLECVGNDVCNKTFSTQTQSFHDALKKAAKTLTYSNPEMEHEDGFRVTKDKWKTKQVVELSGEESEIEIPNNTLMVFRHVLTTPRKDRDNDILRTQGATVDPKMPLLWQHVHTLPIGKMLAVAHHDDSKLSLISAIIDIGPMSKDAATMIDAGMGRFSHGFRALEFSELKEEEGEVTSPGGFDITKFEVMEASLVSVPSNVDAETEEILLSMVEDGKLTSAVMKETGRVIREKRPTQSAVRYTERDGGKERTIETANTADFEAVFKQTGEQNANVAGNGSRTPTIVGNTIVGGNGKGIGRSRSPTEADAENTTQTAQADDAEVKRIGGPLEGSWEDVEQQLRGHAKPFLVAMGISVGERDWTWIAGTFADYAIICIEKPESGVIDEFRYFRADWEVKDGEAKFKGDAVEVDIVTTTQIIERSPSGKSGKAGRVLSRANLAKLQDVREDLDELRSMDLSRAGKAICEQCILKLTDVIGDSSDDENDHQNMSAKDAAALFFVRATPDERKQMAEVLVAMDAVNELNQRGKEFRALVGA